MSARIAKLRQIVAERQYSRVDGFQVDLFTATAIIACYELGNERVRTLIETAPLDKVANVALRSRVRNPNVI